MSGNILLSECDCDILMQAGDALVTEIARMNAAQRSAKSASAYLNHLIGLSALLCLMLHCVNALDGRSGQRLMILAHSLTCKSQSQVFNFWCSWQAVQLASHPLPESDIYSQALLMYDFFHGSLPYRCRNAAQLAVQHSR